MAVILYVGTLRFTTIAEWTKQMNIFQRTEMATFVNKQNRSTILEKLNSGALIRQRTIPIERSPLVGEFSANFSG
jgi:hypothetical protein